MNPERNKPFYRTQNSRKLAYFIHGYCGNPGHFDQWVNQLFEMGYDCKGVLLSGHGGDARTFSKATGEQWKRHIQAELDAVSSQYDKILFVGHSMGCALSFFIAGACGKTEGVIAFNAAAKLHFRPAVLSKYWGLLFGNPERDSEKMRTVRETAGVEVAGVHEAFLFAKPMKELRGLIREMRARETIDCPVLFVISKHDELVSGRAIEEFHERFPDSELLYLPHSTHTYYPKEDRQKIQAALSAFTEKIKGMA